MRGMTSTRPDLLADLNRSIFLFFSPLAEYKPFYFYFIFLNGDLTDYATKRFCFRLTFARCTSGKICVIVT